jgi:L-fuconolactonase
MIDSHQHFWDPARGDYDWLRPGMALYRRFQPDDLAPLLKAAGMHGSILVQAAQTEAETDYLLHLARATPWILGVVGWIDLAARDAPGRIRERARDPLFVGVRPMLQDLSDRSWILKAQQSVGIEAVQERALVFDALVQTDQLPTVVTLADRYSKLSIVLDHAGKPPLGDMQALAFWQTQIRRLAARANVTCKLSGLFTELPAGSAADRVDDCIDLLVDLFGPDRLLWGSDWPVASTAIVYSAWLDRCRERVAARLPAHSDGVFGGNAQRIYRLPRGQIAATSEA